MFRTTASVLAVNYRANILSRPWLATASVNPHPTKARSLMMRDAYKKEGAKNLTQANRIAQTFTNDAKIHAKYQAEAAANRGVAVTIPTFVTGFGCFLRANRSVIPTGVTPAQRLAACNKAYARLSAGDRARYQQVAATKNAARNNTIERLIAAYKLRTGRGHGQVKRAAERKARWAKKAAKFAVQQKKRAAIRNARIAKNAAIGAKRAAAWKQTLAARKVNKAKKAAAAKKWKAAKKTAKK